MQNGWIFYNNVYLSAQAAERPQRTQTASSFLLLPLLLSVHLIILLSFFRIVFFLIE